MRYIIENGRLKEVDFVSTTITNPSDDVLDVLGIGKILVEEQKPQVKENQILEAYYEQTDTQIVKKYRISEEVSADETDAC